MAAVYFISDVHLGLESPDEEAAKEARVIEHLRRFAADAERLYILGDLFDFWFEYRHAIPSDGLKVLATLRELANDGVEVHYLAGNHDFALGSYIRDTIGCIVHPGPTEAISGGTRFFLHHGDGLAGNDLGYRVLKRVLRSPVSQALWRLVHPDLGFSLARRLSHASRGYTAGKDYGTGARMEKALRGFAAEGYDFLLMGHTHVAEDRSITDTTTYVNLGTWLGGGSPYARFAEGVLEVLRPDGARKLLEARSRAV